MVPPRAYRYHAWVLEALAQHGARPSAGTPPERLHDFVNDLYRYELRRLRAALLAREFPKTEYYGRVVALRRRYPLLSLKPRQWLDEGSEGGASAPPDRYHQIVRVLESKLPSSAVSIFEVMSRLARERQAINLSQGFPDFGTSPALVESVARYMREGFNQYPPMPGFPALRQALSMKIERLYGRRYDPDTEMAITTGATEGLYATLTALVHPGDEVVLFQPAYDSYTPSVQLSGGIPRYVTLRYPDYRIDWDEVRRTVTPRTRVIVLNTPHNPTGMVWDEADMRELAAVLEHTDAIVVSDEVYEHVRFDGVRHESLARYPEIASRAVVISSFGKTYHATGWKVGYCAAPAPLITEILRVRQWVTFAVNGAVQMAYADAVSADPLCEDVTDFYQGRRDLFLRLIEGGRFKPLACRGTYFQMLDYSAITNEADADFAMRLVSEHGVASIPISPFLQPGEPSGPVLRFCFAKKDDTLERAAERLRRV